MSRDGDLVGYEDRRLHGEEGMDRQIKLILLAHVQVGHS